MTYILNLYKELFKMILFQCRKMSHEYNYPTDYELYLILSNRNDKESYRKAIIELSFKDEVTFYSEVLKREIILTKNY